MAELVRIDRDGPLATVRLDRPPVNALSSDLIARLAAAFERLSTDPQARVIVLTGSGRAFSAGADVGELAGLAGPHAVRVWIDRGQRLMDRVGASTRPVVAAIEGHCLGGGLELALAAHLRVAGEGARLGLPEIKLGILPGFGGTQRLPRLIGHGPALELMLTGEPVTPERALQLGLVNRVVPAGQALAAARELAAALAARSAPALAAILAVVARGRDVPLREGLDAELSAVAALLAGPDGREGTAAFLEKRPARFAEPPPGAA
ncbi:MAG TPA: enoyl-CoA hydratase-related protein [Chloroflexota bacterium]|nr:enoyl-CoA hydratase-related protein [Chloroflexota bacterium]